MANLRRTPPQSPVLGSRPAPRRRWPWIVAGAAAAILVAALIDGGEEPLRPIAQPVALPDQP